MIVNGAGHRPAALAGGPIATGRPDACRGRRGLDSENAYQLFNCPFTTKPIGMGMELSISPFSLENHEVV
ncbi:hypothetical protein X738_24660 [Mesorhizobium sp. LNHC209A00]|nr:hypothetical protein X738_24660 [Mesorhizobium sp. LNHC209A00]